MTFKYQKNVENKGRQGVFFVILLAPIFISASVFLVYFQDDSSAIIAGKFFGGLSAVVFTILLIWSLYLTRLTGEWDIQVAGNEVFWLAPKGVGEISFNFNVNDIKKVVCEVSGFGAEGSDSYYLVPHLGESIPLKYIQSGINMSKFLKSLDESNVNIEIIQP